MNGRAAQGGYVPVGILLLVIGVALAVFFYLQASPLKQDPNHPGQTVEQGALNAANGANRLMEKRDAEIQAEMSE